MIESFSQIVQIKMVIDFYTELILVDMIARRPDDVQVGLWFEPLFENCRRSKISKIFEGGKNRSFDSRSFANRRPSIRFDSKVDLFEGNQISNVSLVNNFDKS